MKLPPTIIRMIEKYIKHCMWRGFRLECQEGPLGCLEFSHKTEKGRRFGNHKPTNSE
jgi:hypothetical protein